MRVEKTLEGKVALVTGGSRGIGSGVAIALAGRGAKVAVNYLTREKEAEDVLAEVEKIGPGGMTIRADVSKVDEVARMRDAVYDGLGMAQILINNAGIARPQPVQDITEEDWDTIVDTNLKSAFLVTQAFLPAMREGGWGRIVNMSSVAAQVGGVVGPHYAASKAGMTGLTHYYAALLSKEGITVNTIAPALIETEMVTKNPNARPDLIPVGRFGAVEEVADVVVMLAANGYITGQTINVNGGWYLG
jgi:3-oxoacyl-[acyl-carrier protein] reductase